MSMQIDTSKLTMFRNVDFGSENAIVNVGRGTKALVKNKELGSIFSRLGRSGAERTQNNAARTALLKALGQAFGLSGMAESDGKVRFSADFMKKLESILGREVLKTGDFKIASDGTVSSGRPLTQRRINAIVRKAVLFNPGEYNYEDYKFKLEYVKKRLAALPDDGKYGDIDAAKEKLAMVERMMTFIKDEVPMLIDDNDDYLEDPNGGAEPYVLRTLENGIPKRMPLTSLAQANKYVADKVGAPLHLGENIVPGRPLGARLDEVKEPMKAIPAYFDRVLKSYVTTAIDLFIESEQIGKLDKFIRALTDYAICIEAKTEALIQFRLQEIPSEEGPVATYDRDQPLDQCIGRIIDAMIKAKPELMESETFEDFADRVKEELVGQVHPLSEPHNGPGGLQFRPVLDKNGKPVVRTISAQDIDNIGQACIDVINGA